MSQTTEGTVDAPEAVNVPNISLSTNDPQVATTFDGTVVKILNAYTVRDEKWREENEKWRAVATKKDTWQQALAGLVGVYGLIKQYDLMKDYLQLAKEQVKQADRYLKISEDYYNNISLPTYNRQRDLFDRYLAQFGSYEPRFLADAFKYDEYCPDYKLQEGRAIATVQMQFDRARQQRERATGKYNRGRACHDATQMAIQGALAKVAAVNHAYRFEENRKFKYDQWYWQRKVQGIAYVGDMASRVVSGLNGGASVASSGLGAIGNALQSRLGAVSSAGEGYAGLAGFFGGVANMGFQTMGYGYGRSQAMPYGNSGVNAYALSGQQAPSVGSAAGGLLGGSVGGGVGSGISAIGGLLGGGGMENSGLGPIY